MLCVVGWPYPRDGSEHIAWIREFWPALEPFTRGFYTNDLGDDTGTEAINDGVPLTVEGGGSGVTLG